MTPTRQSWLVDRLFAKRGAFEMGAPTDDVRAVAGRNPEDFETIARRYAALAQNQRSFGAGLHQFARFMMVPIAPSFDLDRYDRELRPPFPAKPQYAPQSAVWRREHGLAEPAQPASSARSALRTVRRAA